MKRTERAESGFDVSPIIRSIQYLDEVLKRGVVIGVYEDSMQIDDADVERAIKNVKAQLATLTADMERCLRMTTRFTSNGVQVLQ